MKIEHIAIYVKDLEAARDFFTAYFGGRSNAGYHNPKTGFRSYFISFEGGARLEIMNKPGLDSRMDQAAEPGYAHIAFSVGSREKVDTLTGRLRQNGYPVAGGPRVTGDGYYESCVLDREGNQIELTE